MYKTTIGEKSFEIKSDADGILVDGQPFSWDIVRISENYFHIIHDHKSYRAEIVKVDKATKTAIIKINNSALTVAVKDKFDLLLEKMGMNTGNANRINAIKAPMPGLIINIRISEGAAVKQNDALIVLEAMKMENVIKAPVDAVVKSIKVKKGDNVEKGQVLIEFGS